MCNTSHKFELLFSRPDLYSAIPFSYGTLGFLTAVEIDIIPYKPFIELQYFPVHSLKEAVEVFKRETFSQVRDWTKFL